MSTGDDVPKPGEWHPWYEQYRNDLQLLDWLESDVFTPLYLPVHRTVRWIEQETDPEFTPPSVLVLDKRRAYFGPKEPRERFMNPGINWYVATDQYGRSICSQPREASL